MFSIIGGFLLKNLPKIIGAVLIIGAFYYVSYKVNHWCNVACKSESRKNDILKVELHESRSLLLEAKSRADDLALLWAKQLDKVEIKYVEVQRRKTDEFAELKERAKSLSSDKPCNCWDASLIELFSNTSAIANRGETATPKPDSQGGLHPPVPGPEASEETNVNIAELWVEAAEAYSSVKIAHAACVEAYNGLITEEKNLD